MCRFLPSISTRSENVSMPSTNPGDMSKASPFFDSFLEDHPPPGSSPLPSPVCHLPSSLAIGYCGPRQRPRPQHLLAVPAPPPAIQPATAGRPEPAARSWFGGPPPPAGCRWRVRSKHSEPHPGPHWLLVRALPLPLRAECDQVGRALHCRRHQTRPPRRLGRNHPGACCPTGGGVSQYPWRPAGDFFCSRAVSTIPPYVIANSRGKHTLARTKYTNANELSERSGVAGDQIPGGTTPPARPPGLQKRTQTSLTTRLT